MNLKSKKELFVEVLLQIQSEYEKYSNFNKALNLVCDGFPVLTLGDEYLKAALKLLTHLVSDTEDWISWWLFEAVDKKVYQNPSLQNPFL